MVIAVLNTVRLARAGLVFAQYGVRLWPKGRAVPLPVRLAHLAALPWVILTAPMRMFEPRQRRMSTALTKLGPSYIKLGQFLATRGDIIGPELARDLAYLQDRLPPFSMLEARRAVEDALGGKLEDHFTAFGPPIAAASIAQVHKATVTGTDGTPHAVAVKILRPGVERRFARDLDSYAFAARQVERFSPPSRRLKPTAVVENLARTTELEMDLRLEAAAMSEMAETYAARATEPGAAGMALRVPTVDWRRTERRVLTMEWIDGIPIGDTLRLRAAGFDCKSLGLTVLRAFLANAMRDGFFHADMHQGNLLVDEGGRVVALDFGIMGRLNMRERRFLAEILHGLITRDYTRAAEVHFWAGYVPPHHPVAIFAQALRAIGEPIHGRTAEEISMAGLLGQLFAYTDVFDMETRPELILLQKSMVIVEGVARGLDPGLNLWSAAEPVAKAWMDANLGPAGALRDVSASSAAIGRALGDLPALIASGQRAADALAASGADGLRLDDATVKKLAAAQSRAGGISHGLAMILLAALLLLLLARSGWPPV